eukprot:TRINITY_DN12879_c0_g1_i7.p1 TRINITY_DN12879_c0_g1~~TRINITY_DN12879_c0_g1_i7.p1  ORF type:complete len:357 (-),score=66.08 TRINITY_DN12879_c0_g1_i7:885-1955(-)
MMLCACCRSNYALSAASNIAPPLPQKKKKLQEEKQTEHPPREVVELVTNHSPRSALRNKKWISSYPSNESYESTVSLAVDDDEPKPPAKHIKTTLVSSPSFSRSQSSTISSYATTSPPSKHTLTSSFASLATIASAPGPTPLQPKKASLPGPLTRLKSFIKRQSSPDEPLFSSSTNDDDAEPSLSSELQRLSEGEAYSNFLFPWLQLLSPQKPSPDEKQEDAGPCKCANFDQQTCSECRRIMCVKCKNIDFAYSGIIISPKRNEVYLSKCNQCTSKDEKKRLFQQLSGSVNLTTPQKIQVAMERILTTPDDYGIDQPTMTLVLEDLSVTMTIMCPGEFELLQSLFGENNMSLVNSI